jgi:universal stress protein A
MQKISPANRLAGLCYDFFINICGQVKAMSDYQKILLATDLLDATGHTAVQASKMAAKFNAELSILHVVEPPPMGDPGYGMIPTLDLDLTEQMLETARERLATLAESLSVPAERQWVEVGSPKNEIVRYAEEHGIDLIVTGTHGRHGIGLLLGSTAASVIHHAGCDVLTVRLKG